jgi:hypothetical protein
MLTALCTMLAAAPMTALGGDMYRFTSPGNHYLITTDLDKRLARRIAEHMDRVHGEYDRRLSMFNARDTRTKNLFLFSTQEDYLKTMQDNFGINAANSSGMFFTNERGPMLAAWLGGQSPEQLLETLQHEGFHQFAWTRIGVDLPPWANEGLARYFGDALMIKGKFVTGNAGGPRLRHVQAAIKADRIVPFRQLLTMPTEEWGNRVVGGDAAMQYDQAWSVVYFLINASRGKYARPFESYLRYVSKGFMSDDAFERAFGANSYDSFEKAWKKYILELEPDPLSTAVQRLQFLAAGVKELDKRGVKFDTIEQLKEALRSIRFAVRFIEHGGVHTMTSDDDENFEAPQPAKSRKPAELKLNKNRDPRLPPEVLVEGLHPRPRVTWTRDETGVLSADIEYR